MTRRVNFSAQQRVDLPDMQAIGSFSLQDTRRHVRQLIQGRGAENAAGRVLRGFAVEPDSTPSARIVVKLDAGGGVYGAFVSAVDIDGSGAMDWGHLGGDHDGFGNLEGSAQNILDFTGQPAATYTVKVRSTYSTGESDNRAFWSESSTSELIKATDTRILPQWEIAFQGHSDPEWLTLADVVWGGSTIAATDITDKRALAIEGTPAPGAADAVRWSHATQNDGDTYGTGDFDRSDARGDVGMVGVWESLRALGRQVQDIKGGRESDLRFDAYSRPFAPPGFLAADAADKTTKTLRSIDVVTFTVGDGVTEQGDFNGASALYDCLAFVAANAADLPTHIHVVVKRREGAADFSWPNAITLTDINLVIVGLGGEIAVSSSQYNLGNGLVRVDATGTSVAAGSLLHIDGSSSLRLENLILNGTFADAVTWVECDLGTKFSCRNTVIATSVVGDNAGYGAAIIAPSHGVDIQDSLFVGNSFVGGRGALVSIALFRTPTSCGSIKNTAFEGLFRARQGSYSGSSDADQWKFASHLVFEGCTFVDSVDAGATPSAVGQVDISGAKSLIFRDCEFYYHGDQTCVWGISPEISSGNYWTTENILFDHCKFRLDGDTTHDGFLSGAGGVGGSDGTGWGMEIKAAREGVSVAYSSALPKGIIVTNCYFESGLTRDGLSTAHSPSDGGYAAFQDCRTLLVKGNFFRYWTQPISGQSSDNQSLLRANTSTAGFTLGGGQHNVFEDNFFGDWHSYNGSTWNGVGNFTAVQLIDLWHMRFSGNMLSADYSPSFAVRFGVLPNALIIDGCDQSLVSYNQFINWRDSVTPALNTCVGLIGVSVGLSFEGNTFYRCGGSNIVLFASGSLADFSLRGNTFAVGSDGSKFTSCFDADTYGTAVSRGSYVGNRWDYPGGASKTALILNNGTTGIVMSNLFPSGEIKVVGIAVPGTPYASFPGYGVSGSTNLNYATYT